MIRPGFLAPASRRDLIELARDGSIAHRLARRANALVFLDDGMSCAAVAKVLFCKIASNCDPTQHRNRGKSVGKRVQHKLESGERMSEIGLHFGVNLSNWLGFQPS